MTRLVGAGKALQPREKRWGVSSAFPAPTALFQRACGVHAVMIAALLAVLAKPAQSQVPTVSAARIAHRAAAIQSADGARTLKYVAGGAAIGAAMGIGLGAAWYVISGNVCELASEREGCEPPNYVKLGLLGAAAGAVTGALILRRAGERAQSARVRIAPVARPEGIALQLVFR